MAPEPFRVLFACVGNAARSQMAAAFAQHYGKHRVQVSSGGSRPAGFVLAETIQAMREKGIDLSVAYSKPIDEAFAREADLIVTMGCGDDACPAFIGKRLEDWDLPDPYGKDLDSFRGLRDEIERRVQDLLARNLKPS